MKISLYGKLYSTDITKLDLSRKNLTYIDNNNVKLTDNFIPQSPACDNFYKTYCKTLAGFN